MVDIPYPFPSRGRIGPLAFLSRCWPQLLVLLLLLLVAANWSAVQSLSDKVHRCDTSLGRISDRIQSFLLNRSRRCECDGMLDLSTGCAHPPVLP